MDMIKQEGLQAVCSSALTYLVASTELEANIKGTELVKRTRVEFIAEDDAPYLSALIRKRQALRSQQTALISDDALAAGVEGLEDQEFEEGTAAGADQASDGVVAALAATWPSPRDHNLIFSLVKGPTRYDVLFSGCGPL